MENIEKDNRFSKEFESKFNRLFMNKKEMFELARSYLFNSLNSLLKEKLNESQFSRIRIENGRVKSRNRALLKLRDERYENIIETPEDAFEVLTDFVGTRVTCNTVEDVYDVLYVIKKAAESNESKKLFEKTTEDWIDDYIKDPKPSGYRAVNIEIGVSVPSKGVLSHVTCEVQIRTLLQHAWGELTHEDTYKPGVKIPDIVLKLSKRLATTLSVMDEIASDIRMEIGKIESGENQTKSSIIPPFPQECIPSDEILTDSEGDGVSTDEIAFDEKPSSREFNFIKTEYVALLPDKSIEDLDLSRSQKNILESRIRSIPSDKSTNEELVKAAVAFAKDYSETLTKIVSVNLTDYGQISATIDYIEDKESAIIERQEEEKKAYRYAKEYIEGNEFLGTVVHVASDYALIQLPEGDTGMVHVSSMKEDSYDYLLVTDFFKLGDTKKIKILNSNYSKSRIELALIKDE